MAELTPIDLLDQRTIESRTENGLILPFGTSSQLRVVDCGDSRSHTEESSASILEVNGVEITAGRYFGASSGLTLTGLIALSAQVGDRYMGAFVDEYSPSAFVDLAAEVSNRAHQQTNLDITQHSAEPNEGNSRCLANPGDAPESALGCKFKTFAGKILKIAAIDPRSYDDSGRILSFTGQDLPLDAAREGAQILSKYIPESFTIGRDALHREVSHPHRHTPISILKGQAPAARDTAVVIDMGGYGSSASAHNAAGTPRYHHTPRIASELLAELMPEFNFDRTLLHASGLLIGMATRTALSGSNPAELRTEVIAAEYRVA